MFMLGHQMANPLIATLILLTLPVKYLGFEGPRHLLLEIGFSNIFGFLVFTIVRVIWAFACRENFSVNWSKLNLDYDRHGVTFLQPLIAGTNDFLHIHIRA